jgi:hypothetical protein
MAMRIIVIGMHRSGTSLAAQLLSTMGAYTGGENDLLPATADNRKGYLERQDVVDLNEYVLNGTGAKWYEVSDFDPSRLEPARRRRFEHEAGRIISHLDGHENWLLKDPRMCVTLPLWAPFIKDPAVVFVHRDPVSIAMSLKKRDQFPLFFSLALWEIYTVSAIKATRGCPRFFIGFDDLAAAPFKAAERINGWLGSLGRGSLAMPPPDAMDSLVDPALINHRMAPEDTDRLTPPQLRLHERLVELSRTGAGAESSVPGLISASEGSLEAVGYYEKMNRIERVQRSRSRSLKHLWKLIREGKPRD